MDYEVRKSKKPIIIAFIILSIIIILLVGYVVIDRMYFHKEEEKNTLVIGNVDLDVSSFYNIEDTLNNFDYAFNYENSSYYGYIYKSKKLLAEDFDKTATIYAALRGRIINSAEALYIPEIDVKDKFDKMFGKNASYEPQNIPAGEKYIINYEQEAKRYAYIAYEKTDMYKSGLKAINTQTKIEDNKITITRKIAYIEYIPEADGSVISAKVYGDIEKKNYVGKISVNKKAPDQDEIIGKFGSKLNTYNLVFKQNSKNNNYNFYSIEKVK